MKPEEYIKTIVVYGKMVNVGMDDYGQQYFLEFVDNNGDLVEFGCGAYTFDYESMAKSIIDHRRYQIEIFGEEWVIKTEKEREERLAKRWNKEMRDIVCKEK